VSGTGREGPRTAPLLALQVLHPHAHRLVGLARAAVGADQRRTMLACGRGDQSVVERTAAQTGIDRAVQTGALSVGVKREPRIGKS
jgi:hypothetical protein